MLPYQNPNLPVEARLDDLSGGDLHQGAGAHSGESGIVKSFVVK